MNSIIPAIPAFVWLALFVILNTVVNYMGIEMTARVNKIMLVAELIVLAIFLVIGVPSRRAGQGQRLQLTAFFSPDTFSWPLILGAVSIAVLSFLGFDGISMLAGKTARSRARSVAPWWRPCL